MLQHSDIEASEVTVLNMDILADALYQQFAGCEMDLAGSRHPQFLVEARLFENERGTFMDTGEESAPDAESVVEPCFQTGDFAVCFIDPDGTSDSPGGIFRQSTSFGVRPSDEIERESTSTVKGEPPRVRDLHQRQDLADGGVFPAPII